MLLNIKKEWFFQDSRKDLLDYCYAEKLKIENSLINIVHTDDYEYNSCCLLANLLLIKSLIYIADPSNKKTGIVKKLTKPMTHSEYVKWSNDVLDNFVTLPASYTRAKLVFNSTLLKTIAEINNVG